MRENRGPEARLRNAAGDVLRAAERLPSMLTDVERIVMQLTGGGLRLHPDSLAGLGRGQRTSNAVWWALTAAIIALAAVLLVIS
jgi:ubiquinone biosynthesis protein